MNYEDFLKEFKKTIDNQRHTDKTKDLIQFMADAAWVAFGKLNAKIERDEWGRVITKNQL